MERSEAEAIYDQGREVVVAVLLRMDEQIQRLEQRVVRQDERIAQLERRLNRSSRNSSKPPSTDAPSSVPRRSKDPSGRKPGAQSGHQGHGRELLPACAVDEVIEHWPEECGCGHVFRETELRPDGEPARHQVEELPVLTVKVLEHRVQRLRCPECGECARAELPDEVAASAFGPRLQAALVALSVRNRISRRDVVELGEELFGARLSTGSVDAMLARASEALADPYEDLLARVRAAGALNADETGWRTAGERRALWGLFTNRHAFFQVAPDRHEDHAKRLLAGTQAVVTSDRWWAYRNLPLRRRRQLCWSHLQRDFAAHAEGLAARKSSASTASSSPEESSLPGRPSRTRMTDANCSAPSLSYGAPTSQSSAVTPPNAPATSAAAAWRATSSRPGQRSGRSPNTTACSRRTTTPSAPCAARSSTASSPSEPNPITASGASSDSSQPTPPAASKTNPSSTISPNSSPPTHAENHSHSSPNPQPTERLQEPRHLQVFWDCAPKLEM